MREKKVIAIVGKDNSGKDTLAKHLTRYFSIKYDTVKVKSFNDLLYHYVCELNDIEYDKLDSEFKSHLKERFGREYIIRLANILRKVDKNVFLNNTIEKDNCDLLIIPDLRFINEFIGLFSTYPKTLNIVLVNFDELVKYKKYDIENILRYMFNDYQDDLNIFTVRLNKDESDIEEVKNLIEKIKEDE